MIHFTSNKKQTTSLDAGFIFADGFSWGQIENLCTRKAPEGARLKAISEAQSNRLVKRTKSPTRPKEPSIEAKQPDILDKKGKRVLPVTEIEPFYNPTAVMDDGRSSKMYKPEHGAGKYAVVQYREWSDEYRFSTRVEGASMVAPPEQAGPRVTDMLSSRGAQKISESCYYNSVANGGFTTFLTLTMDTAGRARIMPQMTEGSTTLVKYSKRAKAYIPDCTWLEQGRQLNDQTIQKELSRFLDAAQKMYQRGWSTHYKRLKKSYEDGNAYTPIVFGDYKVQANKIGRQNKTDLGIEGNTQNIQPGRPFTQLSFDEGYTIHKSREVKPKLPISLLTNPNPSYEEIKKFVPVLTNRKFKRITEKVSFDDGQPNGLYTPVYFADKLHYCWVVEVPKNEQGHDNPHVHMMMRWSVPFEFFPQWARRLEKLWGQGFAHLEKIKEPEKAGSYMAKAAKYMTKGADGTSDQGTVRGNRYGISKHARAPVWVTMFESELGIMGSLIHDMNEHYEQVNSHLTEERKKLNEALQNNKSQAKTKASEKSRQAIGRALEKVRNKIKRLPFRTGKYQLIAKGVDAFAGFMLWATTPKEIQPNRFTPHKPPSSIWNPNERPECLTVNKIKKRQHRRQFMSLRLFMSDNEWDSVRTEYDTYQPPEKETYLEEFYSYAS